MAQALIIFVVIKQKPHNLDGTISPKSTTLLKHQDVYDLRKHIESLDTPCFDAEVYSKGLEIAEFYVRNGYVKFLDFSHKLLKDIGSCIRPFLKSLYSGVRYCPGLESQSKEMSSLYFVDRIDVEGIKQDNMFYHNTWRSAFGSWHATEFIEKGHFSVTDYGKLMIKDFGDAIRPEIVKCYEQAREWYMYQHQHDVLEKMDPQDYVKRFDPDIIDSQS